MPCPQCGFSPYNPNDDYETLLTRLAWILKPSYWSKPLVQVATGPMGSTKIEVEVTPRVTIYCKAQQRSDGVVYFQTWQVEESWEERTWSDPKTRLSYRIEKQRARDRMWASYLSDHTTVEPVPFGWLDSADCAHRQKDSGWTACSAEQAGIIDFEYPPRAL